MSYGWSMASDTASNAPATEIDEFASYSEMVDALVEKFPGGGDIQMRLDNGWNDEPAHLFMEQVCPAAEEDLWEEMPEDALGQEFYEKIDSTVNRLMEEGTLPEYTSGDKYFALHWKAASGQ